jgi:hypothetical protein
VKQTPPLSLRPRSDGWLGGVAEGRIAANSAVVFADALLARLGVEGCFDPDEICTLADIEPALRRAGIAIVPLG